MQQAFSLLAVSAEKKIHSACIHMMLKTIKVDITFLAEVYKFIHKWVTLNPTRKLKNENSWKWLFLYTVFCFYFTEIKDSPDPNVEMPYLNWSKPSIFAQQ